MKKIKYCLIICLVLLAYSCEVSYNEGFIDPSKTYGTAKDIDPKFEKNNLVDITQISIYQSYEHKITYKRTYGVSRKLDINLSVDKSVLENYNKLFDTSYKFLPSEYYQIPNKISFEEKSSSIDFEVSFYSKKLVDAVGFEEASNYVLPVRAFPITDKGVIADSTLNTTLLHVQMLKPNATITIPISPKELNFVKNSGFNEAVTISSELNFSGFDKSLLVVNGKQKDVDAYNAANGTEYRLLPAANYQFNDMSVDKQNLLTINGKINANGLDDTFQYLLPCTISSTTYTIEQANPVYFIINITELFINISNSGKIVPNYSNCLKTATGNIIVNLNSSISDDLNINFVYDPSLVEQYNAANGTTFKILDVSKVNIENSIIPGGNKKVNIPYTIDAEGLGVENHYLLPFVLQTENIHLGSVTGSPIIYIDYTKSLLGTYKINKIATSRQRNTGNIIWSASQCPRGSNNDWAAVMNKAQYGMGGDGDYYSILFKVTDTDVIGMLGCKKIEIFTFLELIEETGGSNKITDNKSYYNTLTGEIHIDFLGFESWNGLEGRETYSLTIP